MESELKNKTLIIALKTASAIMGVIAVTAVVISLTGIMAQAPFILHLWWVKCAAIIGLAMWETATIVTKMERLKVSHRNGIIGIALVALAVLTAAASFIIGVGKWLFYFSFALFIIGSIIGGGNEDESSVTS